MNSNQPEVWTAIVARSSAPAVEKLRRLLDFGNPPEFFTFACQQWNLRTNGPPNTWELLVESQAILRVVSHPSLLTVKEAVTITGFIMQEDKQFDTKLLRRLLAQRRWPEDVPPAEIMRTLEILETVEDPQRLSMTLLKFAKFPDLRVQSKVAKILGRSIDSVDVMDELFNNRDGRVRANLLEGLGKRESIEPFLPLIERATRDQHNRVSSIALAIRAQLGHPGSAALIKMRSNSKIPGISESARFAQRIAMEKTSGRDTNGEEIVMPAAGSPGDVDALGVVDGEPAAAAPVEEIHGEA